jgi:hypothetical protein
MTIWLSPVNSPLRPAVTMEGLQKSSISLSTHALCQLNFVDGG